jgi:phage terminase small subunit
VPIERKPKIRAVPAMTAAESLSPESREWYESVCDRWEVKPHHERLLLTACQAWDTSEEMRRVLDIEGGVYFNPRLGSYRPRPEVQIQHDATVRMMRALRDLGLDAPPAAAVGPLALRHGNTKGA